MKAGRLFGEREDAEKTYFLREKALLMHELRHNTVYDLDEIIQNSTSVETEEKDK